MVPCMYYTGDVDSMNLKNNRDRINELMSRFVAQVEGSVKMGMLDINRVSEDVLIPLFSKIYGHTDLRNLNWSEGSNFPAIDLGDEKSRVAYQITSVPDSEKIKATLRRFVEYRLYEKFDRLIIYILTRKQNTYHEQGFNEIIQDISFFNFNVKNDIHDFRDLLNGILGQSLEETVEIRNILEQHFGEDTQYDGPQNVMDWLEQVNNSWGEESGTIKIDRKVLSNDLHDFASRGNGVVIGSPGVGKTYLLKELRQHLKSVEIPHLLLSIDQLGDGTPEDLQNELSYKGDLIEKLKSVPVSDQKAVLLFDAFDAARNEQTHKRFLNLIRRAIQELGNWNVVVTVRTYDGKKSQELLDLFGNFNDLDLTKYQSKEVLCRHFTIPPLNDTEIRQAFDQIPHLESIYNDGSQEFKCLLANPFNLWLLEKILNTLSDEDVRSAFSKVHSEVQLLGMFWNRRIENADNENDRLTVLDGIARMMVMQRSLSIRQSDVRETLIQTAWDDLQSNEILEKVSSTGQRIAFSHNILFDYAISVLLIDDEPQQLEDFILEDESRPLFLRPSLTYFFTRLWYYDDNSASFWKVFWYILPRDQSVHLRLVARLIPTSVIANEARGIEQLEPLLEELQNDKKKEVANEAIIRLLQALQTLQIKHDAPWVNFFDQISLYLHVNFAWDLATLTSDILERAIKTKNSDVIDTCGRIGRRLLEWVWEKRKTSESDWYNRFGGRWAVPLVAKTYGTNIDQSRILLEKVLELTKEDNFPIGFLSWLTDHIDGIWDHDPEFVTSIYRIVFKHGETSDVKTSFGSGSILSMTSTRRQDYSMCQYRLIKHFPNFLKAKPLDATQAAIQSLNFFICQEHTVRTEGMEMFNFRGKLTHFVQDHSYIWDEQQYTDEPIEMADILFEFIAESAASEYSCLDSLLDVFCDHVRVAFFWKRLLKTASQFPQVFAPRLFELCIAKPILMGNDIRYELRLFLESTASEFTSDQLRQIEEGILALPSEATDKENSNSLERRRNQLLAQIPPNLLLTDEAKQIREEMERENDVPKNQRPVSFSTSWGSVTEEKWLQTQGVDTAAPENQELQRFSEVLNKFGSDWLNDAPTREAVELILPQLQGAYAAIKSNTGADKEVINLLWRNLTDSAAILSRVANEPESFLFAFCRQVLLDGAKHELPKPNPERDAEFNFSTYSRFPRDEAARGLLKLVPCQPDAEILDTIEILANDPVPSVRMVTGLELCRVYGANSERFWNIMDNRARRERNNVVQESLYYTLIYIVGEKVDEDKIVRVMAKLLERIPSPSGTLGLPDPFSSLLMVLAINRENEWASRTIEDTFFKNPDRYANILNRLVSHIMKNYVVPVHLETDDGRERMKRGILWVSGAITVAADEVGKLCPALKEHGDEEIQKKLQAIYGVMDKVIMDLYFTVAHEKGQSEKPRKKIPYELRCCFYNEVKPLMERVIAFAQDPKSGVMFAPTAHHFMQVLTSFLSCNPKEVLHLAAGVVKSSEPFGYNLDAIAVQDVVEFVEIVLADYRQDVRDDDECLEDMLNLLDMFAKTGWSDALKLVWRLDEIFR